MADITLNLSDAAHEARFRSFLDAHLDQELLRFTTAGSVDDGKSTLIGRLLHDTKSVYEDQLAAVRASRVNRAGNGAVDLSLLTDGLKAEREQGITIDVAYRYFSTSRRKFIIADTPGHEQYTRNMATGASTADVAIVLIDAKAYLRLGTLLPQSRRHTTIASLLRIPHVVAAINKMDLVDYSETVYRSIEQEFTAFAKTLGLPSVTVIPLSALAGDNVVEPSKRMPFYAGPTLLQFLETVPLHAGETGGPLRFPVQLVARPHAEFRGFAGRVERGSVRPGDAVVALPSGRSTKVRSIVTLDGELRAAHAGQSVTLELAEEIDLSRGEMLVAGDAAGQPVAPPHVSTRFRATVVWMHETPLAVGRTYLAKHTTRTVRATVTAITHRLDIVSGAQAEATELAMNDIAELEFETSVPLFFDTYAESRALGALILIDPLSNATVGAAMISAALDTAADEHATRTAPAFVWLANDAEAARALVDRLARRHHAALLIDDPLIDEAALPAVARALQLAGVTAVTAREQIDAVVLRRIGDHVGTSVIEDVAALGAWEESIR